MTATMGSNDRATSSPTPSLLERHPREQTYTPVNLPPLAGDEDCDNAFVFDQKTVRRSRAVSLMSFRSTPNLLLENRMSNAVMSLPGSKVSSPVNPTFGGKAKKVKQKDAHKIPVKPRVEDSFPSSQLIAAPITGTLASAYPSFIGSARNPFEDYLETFASPPDAVYDRLPGGREAHFDLLRPDAIKDWSDRVEIKAAANRPRSRSSTVSLRAMASTPNLTLPTRKHRPSPLGLASSSTLDLEIEEASISAKKSSSGNGFKRILKATRKSFGDLKARASRQSRPEQVQSSPFDVQTRVPAIPPIPIAYWKQPNSVYMVPLPAPVSTPMLEPVTPISPTSAYSQLRPAVSSRSSYNSAYTAFSVSSDGAQTPASEVNGNVNVNAHADFSGDNLVNALEVAPGEIRHESVSSLDLPALIGSPASAHSSGVPTPVLIAQARPDIVVFQATPPRRPRPRGRSFTSPQLGWSAPLGGEHYPMPSTKTLNTSQGRSQLEPSPIILPARVYKDQPRGFRVVNH